MRVFQRFSVLIFSLFCLLKGFAQEKIYIDCYGSNGGAGWNNINFTSDGASAALDTFTGDSSGISVSVSNRMTAGTSSVSSGSYTGDALEFVGSGSNGAFGSVTVWSGNPVCLRADMVFSGLDTNLTYTFTYFASRNNDGSGFVREGEYILSGASSVTNYLDAADNFTDVAISSPVYPDASGRILLTVKDGPNNTAGSNKYFYLNALKVEYTPVAAPVVTNESFSAIYIDPAPASGDNSLTNPEWNCLNFTSAGATLNLFSTNVASTGIKATVITPLNSINTNGSTSPTGDAAEFAPAGGNSAYGNDSEWVGSVVPLGEVRFEGLAAGTAYTFTMYASRMGVSDTRDAEYTFAGANTNSAVLNASNNSTEVVVVSNVYADASGVLDFSMVSGPGNSNSYAFYYLTAMKIEYVLSAAERTLVEEIIVDVAGSNSGSNWNQIQANSSVSLTGLVTLAGDTTGYIINVTDPAGGLNNNGTSPRVGDAAEFDPMGTGNIFGSDGTYAQSSLQLTGLNPDYTYDFTFFASRMSVSDNREALHTVAGSNIKSGTLDSANNTSNVCYIAAIKPTAGGVIDITYEKGDNNNNGSGYYYLAALKISVFTDGEVPDEPSTNVAKNLLFFGNSFSMGSDIPGLVQDLAVVAGYDEPLVVADLSGGTDLAYHITQVQGFPENNVDSPSLPSGDTWDHVIMQGYSTEATHLRDPMVFKTNAVALYQLVKNHASGKGAGVEGVLYETWARSPVHSFYPGEFADPAAMQLEIRTNYNGAAELITAAEGAGSVRIAGVGDAFETGEFILDLYAADNYHQSDLGAHLAAMVLFKTIYSHDATNLSYSAAVTAGWTTMSSAQWDDLTMWADGVATSNTPPVTDPAAPGGDLVIYIDPHGGEAPASWNNASFSSATVLELLNTDTKLTGITLSVTNTLFSGSTFGSSAPVGDAAEFAPAGNTGAYGSDSNPDCDVLFTGMLPDRTYTFTFYNSRVGVTDNRETSFVLTGATRISGVLDAAGNNSNVLVLSVKPAADGSVLLFIEKSVNNNNADGFYYINAMKITSTGSGSVIILQ